MPTNNERNLRHTDTLKESRANAKGWQVAGVAMICGFIFLWYFGCFGDAGIVDAGIVPSCLVGFGMIAYGKVCEWIYRD